MIKASRQYWLQKTGVVQRLIVQRLIVQCVLVLCSVVIAGCSRDSDPPLTETLTETPAGTASSQAPADPRELLRTAQRKIQMGQLDVASDVLRKLLVSDPNNEEATLLAAQIEDQRENHQEAAELAATIQLGSRFGKQALEFRTRQLVKSGRDNEAADVMIQSLESDPTQHEWRKIVWGLLNRVGRREEASQQAVALSRVGAADQQVLVSLLRRNDSYPCAMRDGEEPKDFFQPGHGMARWYFTKGEFRRGLEELQTQAQSEFESPAADALYGRLLTETQRLEEFAQWHARCSEKVKQTSDYWSALGTFFFDRREYEASARALLEAIYRDPTDDLTAHRLARVFYALGRDDDAEQFHDRAVSIAQSELEAEGIIRQEANVEVYIGLRERLLKLGRPFELLNWSLLMTPPNDQATRVALKQKLAQFMSDPKAVAMAAEMGWMGIDPTSFSMKSALERLDSEIPQRINPGQPDTQLLATPRFSEVSQDVGLDFQWYQDVEINLKSIPIHEMMGGGIAVTDFDLDGWPDVYLAQGSGDPPTDQCTRPSELFRNVNGRYQRATENSQAGDFNFSTGIASGDINQDGFPDLYLGSLGRNRVLINNGDGTFRDATESLGESPDRFTSSTAIGDITGDGLPELFEAVYVEMEGGFVLPTVGADGTETMPTPANFYAQSDRWFESLADGTFTEHTVTREIAEPGTSLGVVITDFDGDIQNEVFVANDVRPNHLLRYDDNNGVQNTADALGLANGFSGSPNGCMGIATADFNRDQTIDLHVTNFFKESANHYMQDPEGGFTDFANRYGIDSLTLRYTGFGTKAIDVDHNGWADLVVTNGHVFDQRHRGRDFQMPPQLLINQGDRFESIEVEDPSGYWGGAYLGRSVALLDYNHDGRVDLLIGHLERPVALLANQTDQAGSPSRLDTDKVESGGHWIQFELIGVQSERDAIGARVVVTAGGSSSVATVTAGDGYLASDQPLIDFGIGLEEKVERVEVRWPSGVRQTFENPVPNNRYLVVEGQNELRVRALAGSRR